MPSSPQLFPVAPPPSIAPAAPAALRRRAKALLRDRFGPPSDGVSRGDAAATAFARGCTGLLAGHTHYATGFALLLPLALGTAVAARPASEGARTRIAFAGRDRTWTVGADGPQGGAPAWVRVVAQAMQHGEPPAAADVAVASTVPAACFDAYMAALSMAAVRAASAEATAGGAAGDAALRETARALVADATGLPFSAAYLTAADRAEVQTFLLVDTEAGEHLPLDAPPRDALGWGLVGMGGALPQPPAFHAESRALADEALAALRAAGFAGLASFRDLEHRDLDRAAAAVPPRLQRIVRHFVTENRRVQRLVTAVRRADWQLAGALLLMSHAALRGSLHGSNERLDCAVQTAEAMSIDGIYGACATSRGQCVLAAGRPFALPTYFDRTTAAFDRRFGRAPETLLL